MIHSKNTFHAVLAVLVGLGIGIEPNRALANSEQVVAQASENKTSFPLLDKLPKDSVITISGTENTAQINSGLEEKFEGKYDGSTVEVNYENSDEALEAVNSKEADLAAISRPLTEAEKAQGFQSVPLSREKIAIIIGADNPFDGSLTIEQFAQIFRGEITNWSEVGGGDQAIKLIDRSAKNDTRRSFPSYPVFQNAEFSAGSNATVVESTDTSEVASKLGADGISYAPVSVVGDLEGVQIVTMHKTLPDDPRYPFSQPNMYVYKGEPSPAAQGFLGFVTDKSGQDVIKSTLAAASPLAGIAGIAAKAPKVDINAPKVNIPDVNAPKIDAKVPDVDINAPKVDVPDVDAPEIDAKAPGVNVDTPDVDVNAPKLDTNVPDVDVNAPEIKTRSANWLWFLLPLAFLIPLLAFLIKKGKEVSATKVDANVRERELVGSGTNRTTTRRRDNDIDNGLAKGAGIAGTGIAGAAIANRQKGGINLPDMPDVDLPNVGGAVDGVKNKFGDVTGKISTPNMPDVDLPNVGGAVDGVKNKFGDVTGRINTPNMPDVDLPNVGGAVDGVKNKFGDVTGKINTPDMPDLNDIKTNFETPELPELNDISTSFETPELPNAGNAIDGIKGKAGDAFGGLKDNLNPNDLSSKSEGILDSLKNKAGDLKDNLGDKASDLKDDLTGDGNH